MSDLISRQAAIEAVLRAEALVRAYGYRYAADAVRELPPAQPNLQPTYNQLATDTIERERKKGEWIPDLQRSYTIDSIRGKLNYLEKFSREVDDEAD